MNSGDIQQLLLLVIMGTFIIFIVLVCVLIFLAAKAKRERIKSIRKNMSESPTINYGVRPSGTQSIMNFFEFDNIQDNMIIEKNGTKYVMVAEIQGVNYDLMSMDEKNGVESGFVQFLNTLRYPIQIYTQTRTVNLEGSISSYRERIKGIEDRLAKAKADYDKMVASDSESTEEVKKAYYELIKLNNLYEYGKDVIFNTEKMSLNRNVLNKQYYIIISYFSSEVSQTAGSTFSKDEIRSIAFSELYTRLQSLIRALSPCGVTGKILNSNDLIELLYMAYNRDDAEVYGLDKILESGYDELYSTAPDVLDKEMEELNIKVQKQAVERANKKVLEAQNPKQQAYDEKVEDLDEAIDEMAKMIINQNESYVGEEVARRATRSIDKDRAERRAMKERRSLKGGRINEQEAEARARARRIKEENGSSRG